MIILDFIRITLGLIFALFIPGYLIVKIFFDDLRFREKVAYAVTFSIITDVCISIFLGYNRDWASFTGGINLQTIIVAECTVTFILLLILMLKYRKMHKKLSWNPFNKKSIKTSTSYKDKKHQKKTR